MGIRFFSLGVKGALNETVHSSISSAQVKKGGDISPLLHMPSWLRAELIKDMTILSQPSG
jgi:hypothetical protein